MAGRAVQCGSFLRAVQKMRLSCWHRACAQCPGQLASVPVTAWITASEAQPWPRSRHRDSQPPQTGAWGLSS